MKQNLFPKQVNDTLKPVKVITAIALDLLEKKTENYLKKPMMAKLSWIFFN